MGHGGQIEIRPSRAPQRIGATFALALHAVAGVAVIAYEPARSTLLAMAPIMVSLVSPPKPEAKPPAPTPPKPRPVMKPLPPKPPEPLPLVTAPLEAQSPSPIVVPPPPPPPPTESEPAPVVIAPPPVITAPNFAADYLDNPPPSYPTLSRRNGEQGRVILRVLVNPGGRADDVEIRTSSGHARLDEAARYTVRRWRFVPAKRGDEPVSAWVLIPISFRLEG